MDIGGLVGDAVSPHPLVRWPFPVAAAAAVVVVVVVVAPLSFNSFNINK